MSIYYFIVLFYKILNIVNHNFVTIIKKFDVGTTTFLIFYKLFYWTLGVLLINIYYDEMNEKFFVLYLLNFISMNESNMVIIKGNKNVHNH